MFEREREREIQSHQETLLGACALQTHLGPCPCVYIVLDCTSKEICQKVYKQGCQEPLGDDCPPGLQAIINQCRDFQPSKRPTAEGAIQALCRLVDLQWLLKHPVHGTA